MSRQQANFLSVCNRIENAAAGSPQFALPADGMIQLVPLGYAVGSGPDGEAVHQLVDSKGLDLIFNSITKLTKEFLVDADHFSHDPTKPTTALAWGDPATAVKRADGIYAKCRITAQGVTDVLGGNLRYISPEFNFTTMEVIEPGLFRPTQFTGAAFTSRPGFRAQKPVTNRDPNQPSHSIHQPMKKAICALLGLDEATADDVVTNRIAETKPIIEKGKKYDALATELQDVRNREVDAIITTGDAYIPKDKETRDTLKALLVTNRVGGEALITGFRVAHEAAAAADPLKARAETKHVHNRSAAETPKDQQDTSVNNRNAKAHAAKVANRAREIQAQNPKMPWSNAFAKASDELVVSAA